MRRLLRACVPGPRPGGARARAGTVGIAALALLAFPAFPAHGAPPRRIVLVTVDGARAGIERAPGMTALGGIASRGRAFEHAVTPSLRTFPATVALLTGRAPSRTGVTDEWSRGAPAAGPVLAGELARAGYRGLALPADPLLHAGTGVGRGFTRFDPASPALAESTRVDTALAWLRAGGRRWVWLGLGFGERPEVWRRDDGFGWPDAAIYARRAARIDAALQRLERGLTALGSEDVVVVVAGTHGAAFAGEDSFGQAPADFEVPLVFRTPRTVKLVPAWEPASLLDVAPTVLELAGARSTGFDGRSLVAGRGKAKPAAWAPTIAAGDATADTCRALLRDWVRNPPARRDSLALVRARKLRQRCPQSARHAIEEATATSIGGLDDPAAQLFLDAMVRFPGDHRVAVAYAEHLLRYRRFPLVPTAIGGIPNESPMASPGAWREALAATGQLDFTGARRAIARAAALSVPAEWANAERAVERLERARAAAGVAANDVDARLEYGRALGDFGVLDEAYSQLHQARMLDSTRVEADLAIAHFLERDRRLPQAVRTLERAVKKAPAHRGARLALAEALAAAGESKAAIPHFVIVLEQDPEDGRSHYNLACLYAKTGEPEAALAALERALAAGYGDWERIGTDPDLEPIRGLPGFAQLERRRSPPR